MLDEYLVNGIPLVAVVIGLVEYLKSVGLKGQALSVASLIIGVVLGVAYIYSESPIVTFAEWFRAIVFGLVLGLVASGLYDSVKSAAGRI
ncbi:MAG: hypothetical protein QXS54_06940 [Candidatus Methanomethylicaceae archaeon]